MSNASTDVVSANHSFPRPSHPQTKDQEQAGAYEQHRSDRSDDQALVVVVDGVADLDGRLWNGGHIDAIEFKGADIVQEGRWQALSVL